MGYTAQTQPNTPNPAHPTKPFNSRGGGGGGGGSHTPAGTGTASISMNYPPSMQHQAAHPSAAGSLPSHGNGHGHGHGHSAVQFAGQPFNANAAQSLFQQHPLQLHAMDQQSNMH
jgi:hypothetical protein